MPLWFEANLLTFHFIFVNKDISNQDIQETFYNSMFKDILSLTNSVEYFVYLQNEYDINTKRNFH